ncbi:MAG: PAS domain S-box-containing protein [Desulforhopalus sp.]|jgi:PAS domain S-box-containing protein
MPSKPTYEELEQRVQALEQAECKNNWATEVLGERIVSLSLSSENREQIDFEDLFELEDLQRLQDDFARATGVASIITLPDGTPLTQPTNFSRLCNDIIRKTEKGLVNCYNSDAAIGRQSLDGPTIQPCLSCGMWDAGAAISVGGKHIANWLIGQVRDESQTEGKIREYAEEIDTDVEEAVVAFREIPVLSRERFKQIAQALFTLANQLSATAYQSVLRARIMAKSQLAEKERRRLEQDYQSLFREMMDGFSLNEIICDEQGKPENYRFLAVNPSFERITGLKGADIVGMTVLEVLPNMEQQWIETFGHVALTGEPAFFENYSVELDKHFAVTSYQPAANQFACIFSDITDRKKAEQERIRFTADLAAKNEELEQMVYVVSHDLRSPLVNIDGYSRELDFSIGDLQRTLTSVAITEIPQEIAPILDEDIPEAIRFIRTSAAKMDILLSGLLRLSRSGREKVTIETLDMNDLITKVIGATEFQIKEAGVTLEVDILPTCLGDVHQINQVFSNIIGNAMKYLDPQRPGTIKISGRVEREQSVYCIEDNGIGMDQAHLNKIFEIFHQLDPMHSKGEGLGLTIVKRVLDGLDGTVWPESKIGIGTRFYVALPTGKIETQSKLREKC